MRGASRPGTSKYLASQINSSNRVQFLGHVAYSSAVSGASTRTLKNVAVAGGTVKSFTSAGATLATGGSGALSSTTPYIHGAELFGLIYFADGTNSKYWDAQTDTVFSWTAAHGTMPSNGANLPRLIATWRSRIVMAGLIGDAHNWFMSAVGDPDDWDYAPTDLTLQDAVAGNNAEAGKSPDVINCIIPFNDDILWFGCDHSIWQLTNDPLEAGRFDLISDTVGMAFGKPYCRDPAGLIYFLGSRGGLYVMTPGQLPVRLSDKAIEKRLADLDLSQTKVQLAWDDRSQHVLIFLTKLDGSATTNYVFDVRHRAFWPESFATATQNPVCVHVLDGDSVNDRVILLGGQDGYVRKIDHAADDDDGSAIASHVFIGPIQQPTSEEFRLDELRIDLDAQSSDITYSIHDGDTAEEAQGASARFSGTWTSAKQYSERRRASGRAMYLKLLNATVDRKWQFEQANAVIKPVGRAAGR